MAKFCTKCGRPLNDGEKCSCGQVTASYDAVTKGKPFIISLFSRMGIGGDYTGNMFEDNQKIIPDIITANDGEIPIKQYEAATLRSRIRGQYAKGRFMITNKRLLFITSGISSKGHITGQQEFALEEIAGVEIKNSNRISPLNIILSLISVMLISPVFSDVFSSLSIKFSGLALFLSIIVAVICSIPFFIIKKKFWLKLLIMNCGLGCLMGTSKLANLSPSALVFGIDTNIADIVGFLFLILWFFNMILVSLVPDLSLCIKTKGATEAICIKRKQYATLFRPEIENTGFSEVLPGIDIQTISTELSTIIGDVQTFGTTGIEKWKTEN